MRIFVATGTQLAFDRLIKAIDEWSQINPGHEVFAQTGPSGYKPTHMEHRGFITPEVFAEKSGNADVIIAHAGTGSIFTALELQTPLIVMPRRAKYNEHRNDHQVATVERFEATPGVNVAYDEHQLRKMLDNLEGLSQPEAEFAHHARPQLLEALSEFINDVPILRKRDRVLKFMRSLRP